MRRIIESHVAIATVTIVMVNVGRETNICQWLRCMDVGKRS